MEPEPPAKRKLDGPPHQASTSDDAALGESLLSTRLLSGGTTRLRPPSAGNFCQLIRLLLLLFLVVPSALGFCETFKTACPIAQIGVPVNNGNEILLANRGSYYLTLTPSASTPKTLQLIASILYGRVEFFVRFGDKEPSSNSFDLSSALSGMPDFLGIPLPVTPTSRVNILVRARAETRLRLLVSSRSLVSPLSLGVPQRDVVDSLSATTSTVRFSYTPDSAAPFFVYVTALTDGSEASDNGGGSGGGGGGGLAYRLLSPKNKALGSAKVSEKGLSATPAADEINAAFTIEVQATVPSAAAAAAGKKGAINTSPPATATNSMFNIVVTGAPGTATGAAKLLAGVQQQGFAAQGRVLQYFVLQTAGGDADVDVSAVVLQGDVRLLVSEDVSESDAGSALGPAYFHNTSVFSLPATLQTVPGSTWSSAVQSSVASVRVPASDAKGKGVFVITVASSRASSFLLRAGSSDTIMTLAEGFPISGVVGKDSYRYFRYYDSFTGRAASAKTPVFDLVPRLGDADLFVGCRVSATGTDAGFPSALSGHYNYSSQRWQEDAIELDPTASSHNCASGVYYLAVLGFSAVSEFTLSAMHLGGTVLLTAGVPSENTIFKNIGTWYKFRLGMEAQKLTIMLTTITGDADLFVKQGSDLTALTKVTTSNFDYRSSKLGLSSDSVVIPETDVCTDCWVSVLVFGYTTSRYTVVYTLEDTTITLKDGMPQRGSAAQGDYQYYTLTAPTTAASATVTVTAVLTVFSGYPVLVASYPPHPPTPTLGNCSFSSTAVDTGNIPVVTITGVPLGQVVTIGVGGGDSNSSYTVRANIETLSVDAPPLLQLLEGVPQTDSISYTDSGPSNLWRYYQIGVPEGHDSLRVKAQNLIGEIDLYVTKCPYSGSSGVYQCEGGARSRGAVVGTRGRSFLPNATWFEFSTVDRTINGADAVFIPRNDQQPCTYLVGVRRSESMFSAYQISYTLEDTILTLQSGVSVQDSVKIGHADYFSFYVGEDVSADTLLKVSLTRLSGDPDLFISTAYPHPSVRNNTWRSVRFGSDVLEISPFGDKACSGCTYYISVMGAIDSTYVLTVTMDSSSPRLLDGVPYSDQVKFMAWNYYIFDFSSAGDSRDFSVSLSASSGSPSLYVTLDGKLPTLMHNQYWQVTSLWGQGQMSINVQRTDAEFITYCSGTKNGCRIIVGVYGLPLASSYWITLTTASSATLLQLNVPVQQTLGSSELQQYRLALSAASASAFTLRFAVTTQVGRLTLYASCTYAAPNATHFQWSQVVGGNSDGNNFIDIASVDAADLGCLSPSKTGLNNFYVSVAGSSGSGGKYSITASMPSDQGTVPLLLPGVPSSGTAPAGNVFRYFYVRPGEAFQDLRVSVTCTSGGDVDVYVSTSFETRPLFDKRSGKIVSFALKSTNAGADEVLVIPHQLIEDQCQLHPSCYFVIGLVSAAANTASQFTVVASRKDSTTSLVEGVPLKGTVSRHSYEFYSFPVLVPSTDVIITVTSYSAGDPDVYVGLGFHPSRGNFTFSSTTFGQDTLTIQSSDLAARGCSPGQSTVARCTLEIGVFGWTNSSFSIVVHADQGFSGPVLLQDGVALNGKVAAGGYAYYKFFLSAGQDSTGGLPTSLRVGLTPLSGTDLDLYLSFQDDGEPGKQSSDYKSTRWSAVSEEILITASMPKFCSDCWVYIAVFGYQAGGSYSIAASWRRMQQLTTNHAVGGTVTADEFRYYSYYLGDSTLEVVFTLTVLSGDADVYVTTYKADAKHAGPGKAKLQLPTRETFTWRSMHYGDDSITVSTQDLMYCFDCQYVVGVLGYKNTSFTLTAVTPEEGHLRLVYNRPQMVYVSAPSLKLFSTPEVLDDEEQVTFSLTAISSTGSSSGGASGAGSSGSGSSSSSSKLADLFVRVITAANQNKTAIDPSNPASYTLSTLNGMDDVLVYQASKDTGVAQSFLLAVVTHTALQYSVVARSSQLPVLLQPGIPQTHFVSRGNTALFTYAFAQSGSDMQDVRISAVARQGDPDLFVSQEFADPHCVLESPDAAPSSDGSAAPTVCTDYTWSSRSFSNDQIIINKDFPCTAVVSSTYVVPSCSAAKSFLPGLPDKPLHVGVFGYQDTKFSVTVAESGQHIQLLPGVPQSAATSFAFICSSRSPVTGKCDDASAVKQRVQMAYFSFSGGPWQPSADGSVGHSVLVSVQPVCGAVPSPPSGSGSSSSSSSGAAGTAAPCVPGCACDPLVLYASSCARSRCTERDMLPSGLPGQAQQSLTIDSVTSGVKMVLGGDNCVAGEDCLYYFAVGIASQSSTINTSPDQSYTDPLFTITASRSGEVVLLPCDSVFGDGTRFQGVDAGSSLYEVCGSAPVAVGLEQCVGSSTLYACAGSGAGAGGAGVCKDMLPSEKSWGWRLSQTQACGPKQQCTSDREVQLPQLKGGSYYLYTEGDGPDAQFELRVSDNLASAPVLVMPGQSLSGGAPVQSSVVTGGVQLTWSPVHVLMPGMKSSVPAPEVHYSAFFVRADGSGFDTGRYNSQSFCGLSAAVADQRGLEKKVFTLDDADASAGGAIAYTFDRLPASQRFQVVVVATCDEACLQQAAKVSGSSFCHSEGSCHPVHFVYGDVRFESGAATADGTTGSSTDAPSSTSRAGTVAGFFILAVCALLCVMGGLFQYWQRTKRELSLAGFDEMEMVDTVTFGLSTGAGDGSSSSSSSSSSSPLPSSSSSSPFGLNLGFGSPSRRLSMGERLSLGPSSHRGGGADWDWDEVKEGAVRLMGRGAETAQDWGRGLAGWARGIAAGAGVGAGVGGGAGAGAGAGTGGGSGSGSGSGAGSLGGGGGGRGRGESKHGLLGEGDGDL